MALIIMAVYDTDENGRSDYTRRTLESLLETVDFNRHRLFISDNGSCEETRRILVKFHIEFCYEFPEKNIIRSHNGENLGTSGAINLGIKVRHPGEHVIKIDNDVVIHQKGWVDEMEEAIVREPKIGIIGLKRKDLRQTPYDPDPNFRSTLHQLPHQPGEKWLVIEETNDIMGTCTMFNSALVDSIGYSYQMGSKYGFEDCLYSLRSRLAGFINCFLPHIEIDHIDTGANDYSQEKQKLASEVWDLYTATHWKYVNGEMPIYYDGGFNEV